MPKEVRNPSSEEAAVVSATADSGAFGWTLAVGDVMALSDAPVVTAPDLMERTARFGESVIRFAKKIPRGDNHPENNRLISQLVGSATSVGANYCEADDAVSGKDYRKSIGTSRKESKEAMFFLRMIATSEPTLAEEARLLWREAKELNLIFGSIWRKGQ